MRFVMLLCAMICVLALAEGCESGGDKKEKGSAAPEPPPPAKLEGTYWKLVDLDGAPVVAPDADGGGEPHLLLDPNNKRAVGSGGVNRFSGSYTSDNNGALRFSPLAATKMAGPEPMMKQEDKFFAALSATTGYSLNDQTLELKGEGRTLAKLDATNKR